MLKETPLILIDGSSYLYRAFHALPPLTNSRGEPTGAIYGVLNMIRKLINDFQPEYIGVVFDPKGKTHRDDIYPHYKANRPPMPDELRLQIQPLFEIIKAMGLPLLIVEGEEADDVIGSLTKQAEQANIKVLISTGDKDMAQLVNDNVTLINTMNNVILDRKGVREKFAVTPEQIIDYLALMGDSSDNIPGVAKVGPKTAAKWLQEFDSLEKIIAHADQIPGKVGENLRAALPQLGLSKELVTIRSNLNLTFSIPDLKPKPPQVSALLDLFKRYEFRSWQEELLQNLPRENQAKKNYQTIMDEAQFKQLLQTLQKVKQFAFDTETTDLNAMTAQLVGVSFSYGENQAFYIPLAHDYPAAPVQINGEMVLENLRQLLTNSTLTLIGQNLKYDFTVLANVNIFPQINFFDTMLESYVLNSTGSRHDLDTLALKHLAHRTITFEDIAGKGKQQLTFNQIAIDKASEYACEDAEVAWLLHEKLWKNIATEEKLKKLLIEIELPLLLVLVKMERHGVLVDRELLQQLSAQFGERIQQLEKQAHELAGKTFNLSSPKQLQEILYVDLKIPANKRTPTGQPSTSEEVLQELALDYPLPKIILEHRSLQKLKSTYTDALAAQINEKTGRVHTSYNQAITSTGRLSSTEPNLQNIPIRTEEGRRIRQAFIAASGYKIIAADYSQIELRIMAHLSEDLGLMQAFQNNADIHTATAAEIFGIRMDEVTSTQRRGAKAINFGLIYGMSIFGLSRALNVERGVAQEYMDLYFNRYPGVKKYMDDIRNLAHKQGFVETIHGRRLYLPEINVSNIARRRAAERAAINAPMQGTAADIIKLAMIAIDQWIDKSDLDIKMLMQVHDELVFEVAEKDAAKAIPFIRDLMTNVVKLNVPIAVEIGVGNNWDEAHG